jgi:dTDP-4-dehydrorhamnose reductase
MKILITGCSGYLGQHFLYSLLQNVKQDEIYSLSSPNNDFQSSVTSHPIFQCNKNRSKVIFENLDLTSESGIDEFFREHSDPPFDICYHIAALASPKDCHENETKARLVNVPQYFFEKLRHVPMVALSTDQVYCGTKAPYMDSSKPNPVNIYGQTKVEMERVLLHDDLRTKPAICLRSSIILGSHAPFADAHSTFLHFCKSRKDQETTFYTDEIRSVISVCDVVKVLLYFYSLVENGTFCSLKSDVYNMGGKDMVSRMDIAEAVAKVCNFSTEPFLSAQKAEQKNDSNALRSPLDISMISSKLEELVNSKFYGLEDIVRLSLIK